MTRFLATLAAAAALAACDRGSDPAQAPDPRAAEAAAFMAENAKQPGVRTLPSGLQYKVVKSGPEGGRRPGPEDEVKVHYEGTLPDGTVFDSSYQQGVPAILTMDRVVPGWEEALQLMRPGDEWYLYLPPKLGYGEEGMGPIPPNTPLVFRIELLGVLPKSGSGLA